MRTKTVSAILLSILTNMWGKEGEVGFERSSSRAQQSR